MNIDATPSEEVVSVVEDALGLRAIEWRKPHTGLTAAERFNVLFDDGTSAFVKAAVDDATERWLRTDHLVMTTLDDFVPQVLAWVDAGPRPVLVMESLERAHWPADHFRDEDGERNPVLWREGDLDRLVEALSVLGSTPAPPSLPPLEIDFAPQWPAIAERPSLVIDLGLGDPAWFEAAIPELAQAEQRLELAGDSLVHNDVRSDNVCFLADRVVLVDWSDARRGPPGFDLANLIQTLPLEGGPDPFDVLPDAGPFAASRAGQLIHRAAGPAPDWLVNVFKRMALIDLDWATRALDLPPRPGPHWTTI